MAARMPHSPAPTITIPRSSATGSAEIDQDAAVFDLRRIGLQIDADRGALGLAGLVVEAAVMHRALDDVAHHQTIGKLDLLMGAEAVGRVILVLRTAIDRVVLAAMVERHHVFFVDRIGSAGIDPFLGHRNISQRLAAYSAGTATA